MGLRNRLAHLGDHDHSGELLLGYLEGGHFGRMIGPWLWLERPWDEIHEHLWIHGSPRGSTVVTPPALRERAVSREGDSL